MMWGWRFGGTLKLIFLSYLILITFIRVFLFLIWYHFVSLLVRYTYAALCTYTLALSTILTTLPCLDMNLLLLLLPRSTLFCRVAVWSDLQINIMTYLTVPDALFLFIVLCVPMMHL